jgi:hypothetical protein
MISYEKEIVWTMTFSMRQFTGIAACALLAALWLPSAVFAQSHVVSSSDLQNQAVVVSKNRQHNLETVEGFLSSTTAQKALTSAHMDPGQVKTAVSTLSSQELEQLAARTQKAQADFAAGTLSDRDLLIILLAIAALVLIIVAVR